MFVTQDNAGLVRINYTTDVKLAQRINVLATEAEAPAVSSPVTMGGYRFPILEHLAQARDFQILKTTVCEDKRSPHGIAIHEILHDINTVYAYVDTNTLTVVQIDGWDRNIENLGKHGWVVTAAQKTFKRLKGLNRPFRLWDHLDRPLRVAIVDDDGYCDSESVDGWDSATRERLLDGAFVIHPRLFEGCMENLSFPVMSGEVMSADDWRAATFRAQTRNQKAFNARIYGDFHVIGGDEIDKGSFKGQAFIDVSDTCDRMGVDIIAPRSALKDEVCGSETFVLLEPQSTKWHANGDKQSISNVPALFDPNDVATWISAMMQEQFEGLCNDKLLEQWYNLTSPAYSDAGERRYDDTDLITLTKWNARAWVMSGLRLKDSPWLFQQMAQNLISAIKVRDIRKMRIPMPCAVRCQVISASMASMAGCDVDIQTGSIRWLAEHEVLVVHDDDWLEMYESHGGMDLDDFFVGYWRTINNLRKVVIMRSPNDYGEYSIFDYVEGDWYPTEQLGDNYILFPEVSGDPKLWPKRLSEAIADGEITYVGLPSERGEHDPIVPHPYGLKDVYAAMINNANAQSCVGRNVNARGLWATSMNQHRPVQLAPMESCIDTGAQGGHADDILAVTDEADSILSLVVNDPSQPKIDHYTWATRFEKLYGIPFDASRLESGHLTQIHNFREVYAEKFMEMVKEYVNEHVGTSCDPRIHGLGARFLGEGYDIMLMARRNLMERQQNSGRSATGSDWDSIHRMVVDRIEKLERPTDRHDLMMGLYSACLKFPARTTGRVSDQLVMNPALFDKLMAALRFYGIAGHLMIDVNGKITRWLQESWDMECTSCHAFANTTDPMQYQQYHAAQGLCPTCAL